MEFSKRKLPKEAIQNLRICPIHTVQPFAFMLSPVYVFMKMNEKFVSVKAPLDFFTPEELERMRPFESFFMPSFVDSALPFRSAARGVRALISWSPRAPRALDAKDSGLKFPVVALPPAPYELSDAVLRLVGPLWGEGAVVEPFFVSVFANEVCDLLPGEMLRKARDSDVERYEHAIFLSSWCVFLALHLGYCDLDFLNRLRLGVFEETVKGQPVPQDFGGEVDELLRLAFASLSNNKVRRLGADFFDERHERVARKLSSRITRVKATLIVQGQQHPTIYGQEGFVDA